MISQSNRNDKSMNSNRKQRDALEEADIVLSALGYDASSPIRLQIKDALDETVRNCDIGSADEQLKRHDKFCASSVAECSGVSTNDCIRCFACWSQMPYEKGENND